MMKLKRRKKKNKTNKIKKKGNQINGNFILKNLNNKLNSRMQELI
jgi:hypothetical protein